MLINTFKYEIKVLKLNILLVNLKLNLKFYKESTYCITSIIYKKKNRFVTNV